MATHDWALVGSDRGMTSEFGMLTVRDIPVLAKAWRICGSQSKSFTEVRVVWEVRSECELHF